MIYSGRFFYQSDVDSQQPRFPAMWTPKFAELIRELAVVSAPSFPQSIKSCLLSFFRWGLSSSSCSSSMRLFMWSSRGSPELHTSAPKPSETRRRTRSVRTPQIVDGSFSAGAIFPLQPSFCLPLGQIERKTSLPYGRVKVGSYTMQENLSIEQANQRLVVAIRRLNRPRGIGGASQPR